MNLWNNEINFIFSFSFIYRNKLYRNRWAEKQTITAAALETFASCNQPHKHHRQNTKLRISSELGFRTWAKLHRQTLSSIPSTIRTQTITNTSFKAKSTENLAQITQCRSINHGKYRNHTSCRYRNPRERKWRSINTKHVRSRTNWAKSNKIEQKWTGMHRIEEIGFLVCVWERRWSN